MSYGDDYGEETYYGDGEAATVGDATRKPTVAEVRQWPSRTVGMQRPGITASPRVFRPVPFRRWKK